jgi:hypothetical protein
MSAAITPDAGQQAADAATRGWLPLTPQQLEIARAEAAQKTSCPDDRDIRPA